MMEYNKGLTESNFYLDEFATYLMSIDKSDSTIKTYIEHVQAFAKWFEETNGINFDPIVVTEIDIRDMRSYLQGTRHLKETTINLRLASLKSYFEFLEGEKYIKNNPAKAIKKIKIQSPAAPKSLDEQTYRALRRHIYRGGNKAHIAMFEIFTRCGVRNLELINIRIADIDITERKGNLKVIGKQNKVRYIPLHRDVRDAINNWMTIRKNIKTEYDNLFISERKTPYTRSGIWKIFKKYCAQIGITDVTIHSFRHYFCRTLLKNGVDISIVAQLAGHASGYVTAQVYTIPRQEELEAAIETLI
ncbi:tyrosine-type recombinase/integrase [Proteiniborus sp. MB09-C3]|uniref:tyrosine-type recombinase/integrase n=1 Tax=Proteiniborus sp. MB09-C3 TaxID=3050072 RepID=UPI002556DF39|nr:tyrosine-type recombinase/integrase [Proteiniborus sp. MB09-C3]WIV12830.1 tyrosine-type recombinase/integrase [Proteiniborus sp. MB09-C3]